MAPCKLGGQSLHPPSPPKSQKDVVTTCNSSAQKAQTNHPKASLLARPRESVSSGFHKRSSLMHEVESDWGIPNIDSGPPWSCMTSHMCTYTQRSMYAYVHSHATHTHRISRELCPASHVWATPPAPLLNCLKHPCLVCCDLLHWWWCPEPHPPYT